MDDDTFERMLERLRTEATIDAAGVRLSRRRLARILETAPSDPDYFGVRIRVTDGAAADRVISRVMDRFAIRGADCWWAVHPSATPPDVGDRLAAVGLEPVSAWISWHSNLGDWRPPPAPTGIAYQVAEDEAALRAYTDLTLPY